MTVRFSIRDLLWLAVVAALAIGWWLDHAAVQQDHDQLEKLTAETQAKADELDGLRESVKQLFDRGKLP